MELDKGDKIFLLGDFNLPGYRWTQLHGTQGTTGSNPSRVIRDLVDSLLVLVNSFNLMQCIHIPNLSNVFLDLALTNISKITRHLLIDLLCKLDIALMISF